MTNNKAGNHYLLSLLTVLGTLILGLFIALVI